MRYIISLALTTLLAAPAMAEVPRVVTDIHPVHSLVAQVMGDLGQPELLLAKGADEHDFALKPSQAASIADAQLVVWIGPSLTPWLERALQNLSSDVPQLGLLAAEPTYRQDFAAEEGHDHEAEGEDHDHDAKAEEGHDHAGEDDHEHSGTDPHVWLDPSNALAWLPLIAAELSQLDPEHAATYQANAATAGDRIKAMDADLATQLAPLQGHPFAVFHEAYGYFAHHYGLTVAGSIAAGDAATPGAARLTALRDTLAADHVTCIFPEVQHDPVLVAQIAADTGVTVGGAIDPVGSSLDPGPGLYDTLLRGLANTLTACIAP